MRLAGAAAVGVMIVAGSATGASAQQLSFIRDAEIEELLGSYAKPIFAAAGLGSQNIKVRIVKDRAFNAFVLDGRNVFINSGALVQSETPNEIIGVIAHETGHIAGGHLAGLRIKVQKDLTRNLLAKILGLGALIAGGAAKGDSKDAIRGIGQGTLLGSDYSTMRSILSYQRVQESSADQAGVKFLTATKQSGKGMLDTFKRFAQEEMFSAQNRDPYLISHPMAQDRLNQLQDLVEAGPYYSVLDPPERQLKHDLMRAKLTGYLTPALVSGRYPLSDTSLPAQYARAIAAFNAGGIEEALPKVEALIATKPEYPYFWELEGDLQFRRGDYAAAIGPYRKALKLSGGKQNLIRVSLAQSILNAGDKTHVDEAIEMLRLALGEEDNANGYRQLANAYYEKGNEGMAYLATAQATLLEGNVKDAKAFAKRAQAKLAANSPNWLKADDIVNMQEAEQ